MLAVGIFPRRPVVFVRDGSSKGICDLSAVEHPTQLLAGRQNDLITMLSPDMDHGGEQ